MDQNDSTAQPSSPTQCINCQSALATLWCELCAKHYCVTCSSDIHRHRAFSDHHSVPLDQRPSEILLCAQCSKKKLDFFCHDCAIVVCADCLLSTHNNHNFVLIDAASKDVVIEAISDAQNTRSSLDRNLDQEFKQIDTIENINIKKIQDAFVALHKMLDDHEQMLLKQVSMIERKNKNLIESYQRQLFSCNQEDILDLSKVFLMVFATKDYGKGIKVEQEFLKKFNRTVNEMRYLQPPVRILYDIEGLDQLETIGHMFKHIRIVEEELQSCDTERGRNSKLERSLADNTNCEKLTLRGQQLNNQDMIVVAHLLRETTTMTNLNVSMNQIGASGVHSLTTALLINKTLTKLNLSELCVDDQGARYLADMLGENTTLTKLYLDNNQIGVSGAQHLANALRINKTLTVLRLANNTIGDVGVQHLADALKTNKTLVVLDLSDNYIQAKGTKHLAQVLLKNKTLTKLYLSRNMIQDEGALHLANAFKKETVLTALYIAANSITERGARYLINSLQENVTLSTLNWEFNQIEDDLNRQMQQTIMIIGACKKNKEIEDFRLYRRKKKAQASQ